MDVSTLSNLKIILTTFGLKVEEGIRLKRLRSAVTKLKYKPLSQRQTWRRHAGSFDTRLNDANAKASCKYIFAENSRSVRAAPAVA